MRAVLRRIGQLQLSDLLGKAIVGSVFVFIGWGAVLSIFASPEEKARNAQQRAQQEAQERLKKEQGQQRAEIDRSICTAAQLCKDYGAARQACATAGSFETCLSVKLGSVRAGSALGDCTEDGRVTWVHPDDMPGTLRCLALLHLP